MAIKLTESLTTPAIPAKTYSEAWVSLLTISAPTSTNGSVRVELSAYDPSTGEIKPGGAVETITTDDMMKAVMDPAFPEAAELYAAVVKVVEPFRAWALKQAELAKLQP